MKLNSQIVNEIFKDCLFENDKFVKNPKIIESVNMKIGFDPEKLKKNNSKIKEMLNELSDDFHKNKGGGMSFLNMCDDRNGNQWTGSQRNMDELVALGLATDNLSYLLPRDMWQILPGGMPYLVIK